jgi:4-hydroxy-tetrahydrodipicolinate synthase/4-hydroxy-2-oxoglutarate aldolase
VTPFDTDGDLQEDQLRSVVGWVVENGVDFVVPCGSNSEAELMTLEERARVIEVVTDASSVPVVAGVGHPGFRETVRQLDAAVEAGVDAALVVTPFYFTHDQETLANYYRDLADESEVPLYLYSVPAYTGVALTPETVGALSTHENVHGIKDSSGDLQNLQRLIRHSAPDFDVLVGSGGVYAQALEVGATGGVLALANVAPDATSEIRRLCDDGDYGAARERNRQLVELNHAVTAKHGVPGLKAAMRARGVSAGVARRPFSSVSAGVADALARLVEESL